jgi:large subunit ribosomal protein L31e
MSEEREEEERRKEAEAEEKEKERIHVERIYTIPLRNLSPSWRKSEKAIFMIRKYLARHLKADPRDIHLDPSINEEVFSRGAKNPPRKIRIRAMKFEDGVVEAELKR